MAYSLWVLLNKVVSPTLASQVDISDWEISSANSFSSITFENEKHLLLCSLSVML